MSDDPREPESLDAYEHSAVGRPPEPQGLGASAWAMAKGMATVFKQTFRRDNTEHYRSAYADYFAFLAEPANGFRTMTLPFAGGLELSVRG